MMAELWKSYGKVMEKNPETLATLSFQSTVCMLPMQTNKTRVFLFKFI